MNIITAYLKKMGRTLLTAMVIGCALSSCDSVIYDNEGDCSVTYRVAFCYDRNMKWADAFAHEVKSVHLYAFDKNDVLVWHKSEKGDVLAADGYTMALDLPAGDYHLVAWCGLENDADGNESFSVPEVSEGKTRLEELQCQLYRSHEDAGACCRGKLYSLFHGMLDVNLPDLSDEGGERIYTVPLTKNTNHVRIILQHLSGEKVNPDDFIFRIEEENGLMNHDNSLLPDEKITYWAYQTKAGTASADVMDYPHKGTTKSVDRQTSSAAITSINVAIADLSIARLMEGRKTYLTVETVQGDVAIRIPLTDYALMIMDGYDREMTPQEYLDRQDEYSLTFFLDERDKWISTSVIINSWKVVLDNVDFD